MRWPSLQGRRPGGPRRPRNPLEPPHVAHGPDVGVALVFVELLAGVVDAHAVHAVEVVLLERQPLRASLRRANLLMSSWRSEALIQLLVAALVVVAGSLVVALAGAQVIRLLFWSWLESGGEAWQFWFHPGMSPLAILLPWPFVAYLATVRFLAYIDLRTRREGWELELELRRAGRRLEPVGEESHSQIRPSVGPVLPLVVLLLGLTPSLSAAEGSHLIVQDQLDGAPWYDSETGAWKRVDLPEEEIGNQYEDGTEGIPGFAYLMYALVALATALIIVQFVRQRRGNRSPGRIGDSTNASARWSALPFALAGSTGDPEAAFRAACAAGEWTRAVIWLYAWQLLRLEGAGVVRLLPGKTNRVYVREAAAVPAAGEALAETVAIFERAHFGHQPAKRSEILGLVARHRDLLAALPRPSGAAS